MAQVLKRYSPSLGVDLREPDLTRPPEYASLARNARYLTTNTLTSRYGYQWACEDKPSYGMFLYDKYDQSTRTTSKEVVFVSDQLYRLKEGTVAITYTPPGVGGYWAPSYWAPTYWPYQYWYSGGVSIPPLPGGGYWAPSHWAPGYWTPGYWGPGGTSVPVPLSSTEAKSPTASHYVENGEYHFKLFLGSDLILDIPCGDGTKTGDATIQTLKTSIDAIANFTCSVTGPVLGVPLAFLNAFEQTGFDLGKSLSLSVCYDDPVPYPSGSNPPFSGIHANRSKPSFEIASSVSLYDSRYFATPWDELIKYDGQKTYRTGLPQPSAPTATETGTGVVPGTNIKYRVMYVQVDANGYEHYGIYSDESLTVSPGGTQKVQVAINHIAPSSGFNTDQAVLLSSPPTQTGTTFQCESCTLKVGDTVFLIDNSGVRHDDRIVSASTSNSFSVSGGVLTLSSGSIVSANLRVRLFRQVIEDGVYYFVEDWPHDSRGSFSVLDNEEEVGYQMPTPSQLPSVPPKGLKNLIEHEGLLVASIGDTVYYSNAGNPEGWYGTRSFDVAGGGEIRAMSSTQETMTIFKDRGMWRVIGKLNDFSYQPISVTDDIGCPSHASIIDISGDTFFCSNRGVYKDSGSARPTNISEEIVPLFSRVETDPEKRLVWERTLSVHDSDQQTYLLFVPCESTKAGEIYANDNSIVISYNYRRKQWFLWDGLNFAGGVVCYRDMMMFAERGFSTSTASLATKKARRSNSGTWIDDIDHVKGISFEYGTGWEALGEPETDKEFTDAVFYSNDPQHKGSFTLQVISNLDLQGSVAHSSFDVTFGSGGVSRGFGKSPFGKGPFGDPTTPRQVIPLLREKAKSIRFVLKHDEPYRRPLLSGWGVEVYTVYEKRVAPQ